MAGSASLTATFHVKHCHSGIRWPPSPVLQGPALSTVWASSFPSLCLSGMPIANSSARLWLLPSVGLHEDSASVTLAQCWPVVQERVCWGLVRRRHNQKLGLQTPHGRSCLLTIAFQQAVGNQDRLWATEWWQGTSFLSAESRCPHPVCLFLPFPLGLISNRTCLSCSAQPLRPAVCWAPSHLRKT